MDGYHFSVDVRVRFSETDAQGIANNAVYLNYLEEARSEFLKQIGLSFHDLAGSGVHLVIVEAQVKYVSSARYGDENLIRGAFRNMRPVSVEIASRLGPRHCGQSAPIPTYAAQDVMRIKANWAENRAGMVLGSSSDQSISTVA